MRGLLQRIASVSMVLALIAPGGIPLCAQTPAPATSQQQSQQPGDFVMKVNAELVLTNVVARDSKTGELVHGLQQSDFALFENGKPQQVASFDFESVDRATPLNEATVTGLAAGLANGNASKAAVVARPEDLAQSSTDCHVLRPDLDAAGGPRPQR